MAYKFQLGSFVASGSILAEDNLTSTDDVIARADIYASGSLYVPQVNGKLVLDNDKDSYIMATNDDVVEIVTGGDKIGLHATNTAVNVGNGGVHALTLDSEGGASTYKLKNTTAAALDIKQGGTSYLKFDTNANAVLVGQQMSGAAGSFTSLAVDDFRVDGNTIGTVDDADLLAFHPGQLHLAGAMSASSDLEGGHLKSMQMTIGYDGEAGSKGHFKLGAGGDMQLAVFSDNALIMNNTISKDIQFQVKTAGGDNIQPLKVVASAVTHHVDIAALALSGTLVSSNAGELNLVDGSSAATIVNSKAVIYGASGEVNATTLQIAGSAITSTAAELNLMDGGSSPGTDAIADGDGLIINDGGVMKQTTVETLAAYLDDEITAMPNLVTTAATTVGVLGAGSIASGFGDINIGASALSAGALTVNQATFNGRVIMEGDLHVKGATTTVSSTNTEFQDVLIGVGFASGSNDAAVGDRGLIFGLDSEDDAAFYWDESDSEFAFVKTDSGLDATAVNVTSYANIKAGVVEAASFSGPMALTVVVQANGSIDLTAAGGKYVVVSDALAANRATALPASPAVGDQIDIKLHQAGQYSLRIEKGAATHSIDGGDSVILESDYAAIKLVYVAANDWRVF